MNTATKLPASGRPVLVLSRPEQIWVENTAEQLWLGADVRFKRFGKPSQGVTQERFHEALDELLFESLGRSGASRSSLGKMAHGIETGDLSLAREGLREALGLEESKKAMQEKAEGLLRPLAHDGLIAQREDEV